MILKLTVWIGLNWLGIQHWPVEKMVIKLRIPWNAGNSPFRRNVTCQEGLRCM